MNIENSVFNKYIADFSKLKQYGFKKKKNILVLEQFFKNNLFKAVVSIDSDGNVSGLVIDIENNDEFLPLRQESNQGAFIGEIRAEYKKVLENIRDNCFLRQYFSYSQSNRITNLVIGKYGDKPEFLWEKFSGTGVFRNKNTNKWYLAILDVDRSKIQPNKNGLVEVADIKLPPDYVQNLLKKEHFYPAYHMNKKYWITIILDDTVSDKKIMELVDISYGLIK